jgi:hypothetical protein
VAPHLIADRLADLAAPMSFHRQYKSQAVLFMVKPSLAWVEARQ